MKEKAESENERGGRPSEKGAGGIGEARKDLHEECVSVIRKEREREREIHREE